MTTTSAFTAALRDQIGSKQAEQPRRVYRHSARLLDLLDRPARSQVDRDGDLPQRHVIEATAHRGAGSSETLSGR